MIRPEDPPGAAELRKRISRFAASCCHVLEDAVADGEEFVPALAVYRDGANLPLAIMLAPGAPGMEPIDQMEIALPLVATGFDGDLLVLVTDTYHTTSMVNPATGERWSHGEMGIAFKLGNPGGVIEEALSVCASTPDGTLALLAAPYVRHGRKVEWTDWNKDPAPADEVVSGRIPQLMLGAWQGTHLVVEENGPDRQILDDLLIRTLIRAGLAISTGEEEE